MDSWRRAAVTMTAASASDDESGGGGDGSERCGLRAAAVTMYESGGGKCSGSGIGTDKPRDQQRQTNNESGSGGSGSERDGRRQQFMRAVAANDEREVVAVAVFYCFLYY